MKKYVQPAAERVETVPYSLLDRLLVLQESEDEEGYAQAALALLDAAFPGALITFDRFNLALGTYEVQVNRELPGLAAAAIEVGECVATDNPLVDLILGTGTTEAGAWRLSDHLGPTRFRDTRLYAVGFRPFGVGWQLAVAAQGGGQLLALGVNRDRDFSDAELRLGASLATHLRSGLRTLERRAEIARLSTLLPLAAAVLGRSPAQKTGGRLTSREEEVLHWIVEGKRNGEIARILGVSAATVKRHCENLYAKLGVETRTAAALRGRRLT